LEPIKKVARTLKAHLDNLLNYFAYPITNAVTEGLNRKIQQLKANARGFRSFLNYRTRILFFCLENCGKDCRVAFRGSAGILPVLAGILPASLWRPGGWRGDGSLPRLSGRSARCRPERARRPRSPLPSVWPRR
jgi:hypothetical protein